MLLFLIYLLMDFMQIFVYMTELIHKMAKRYTFFIFAHMKRAASYEAALGKHAYSEILIKSHSPWFLMKVAFHLYFLDFQILLLFVIRYLLSDRLYRL